MAIQNASGFINTFDTVNNILLDIRNVEESFLAEFFESHGEKKFRAKQVMEWLWKKSAKSFDEMTNISAQTRELLHDHFSFATIKLSDQQISTDKTIKCAFEVEPGKVVEGVLIPTATRMTACISSQVGCSLSCAFCATGRLKMLRNLTAGDIYDQVVYLKNQAEERYQIPLSNIVYMGMGEPLLNYKNVMTSIEKITSPNGLGMSPQRITVSTAGVAKMIKKLGDDGAKFNLALSLHAANDEKRNRIMDINESNHLDVLADSLRYFHDKTGTRVTFEYIIFKDFNDSIKDAHELANYCKNLPVKINIIEYNPIDDGLFQQASPERVDAFAKFLESRNLIVNVRRSRGKDIDAACGQLANKNAALLKDQIVRKAKPLI
jgi:23S rRNA (adenine2503-C2)-methyltransferase